MRGIKRKTNTREHKDLQSGQIGVQFEEVAWNRADLVTVQIPKRKKGWNEMDDKEKQEHGNTKTYKVVNSVFLARKPSGIVLIWLSCKYLKEKKLE